MPASVPLRGADIQVTLPDGIVLDVKSTDYDATPKEEQYYVVGGGGYPRGRLTATTQSVAFAGIATSDSGVFPAGFFGATGSLTTLENLPLTIAWGENQAWNGYANLTQFKATVVGDGLVAVSGQLSIVGPMYQNGWSSSSAE
jgi:hypothetical protein